jgi:hypothetical protein
MNKFLIACAMAALLSNSALAGGQPTYGQRGYFGVTRGEGASKYFNPTTPNGYVPNIGSFFSARRAGNSTDNHVWMNQNSGMHIPARNPAPYCATGSC